MVRLEECREVLVRLRRVSARGGDHLACRRVLYLRGDELARVASGGFRLADGPVAIDPRHEREVQVPPAVLDVRRRRLEARAGRRGKVPFGTKPMEEEDEDTLQRGIQVRIGLPPPFEMRLQELASAQRRQDRIAVDLLLGREPVIQRAEAPAPLDDLRLAPRERFGREVLRALVVCGEAQHACPGRRFVVALVEIALDERGERFRRHAGTSVRMAEESQ